MGKALMVSAPSGQMCPAHPSNFSTSKPDLDLNIWKFNKADENQEEKFEEGVVLLRCSVHDADHAQWLVEQGRGRWKRRRWPLFSARRTIRDVFSSLFWTKMFK